jgi:hypothetical protein
MSIVVKLLNGDLISCPEKEVDPHHLSQMLGVHPSQVHITPKQDQYYQYLVTVTPKICLTLKREWLSGISLSFLQSAKNESILKEYIGATEEEIIMNMLANPHPLLENVIVETYLSEDYPVEIIAQNPNDRVLTAILNLLPSPALIRGLARNPNPRAISYLIERFQQLVENWEEITEYGFDLLENELFCDWKQVFALATLPEHIAFIFGLFKRSNIVYKLIHFCPDPLAHELLFGELESESISVDWCIQRYSQTNHTGLLQRMIQSLSQTGQIIPRQLFRNNSDQVVSFLLNQPDHVLTTYHSDLAANTNDKAVRYCLERMDSICWRSFLTNSNPMAVDACKKWLSSLQHTRYTQYLRENTNPEILNHFLALTRDLSVYAEDKLFMSNLMQCLARREDIDIMFV